VTSADDTALVIQLRKGNHQAFEQIFNIYHQRIYNFCLRLLPDIDKAEEIVQQVFVALWDQKHKLDESKLLAPYLFSIARYMVYQEFRYAVYRKAAFREIAGGEAGFREITRDEVLFKELSDIIQKLIEQLPPRRKEIFRLSRDSGLSYKEIAIRLDITENTVDTQIRRAIDYLQKEYEMYYR
jgi:RNA polymerase sigma-70 factor (ECF subfamily)